MAPYYKYVSQPEHAEFLLKGELKFTNPAELNDPSELVPNVVPEDVVASLAGLREVGYSEDDFKYLKRQGLLLTRLAPHFQAVPLPKTAQEATRLIRSSFYEKTDVLIELLQKTAHQISKKIGVLCLTRRIDSLPMWAHYAQNAMGVVVEFVDLEALFPGDDTQILNEVLPVRYERHRKGVTFDPRSHETLFFSKFPDWAYEEEVRVVMELKECRQKPFEASVLHIKDVPARHVTSITFGWRVSDEIISAVVSRCRSIHPDFRAYRARIGKLGSVSRFPVD